MCVVKAKSVIFWLSPITPPHIFALPRILSASSVYLATISSQDLSKTIASVNDVIDQLDQALLKMREQEAEDASKEMTGAQEVAAGVHSELDGSSRADDGQGGSNPSASALAAELAAELGIYGADAAAGGDSAGMISV